MTFSEFGRRVAENARGGTDHGTSAPLFVAGPMVKGGYYGDEPSLTDLADANLKFSTDFRSVYTPSPATCSASTRRPCCWVRRSPRCRSSDPGGTALKTDQDRQSLSQPASRRRPTRSPATGLPRPPAGGAMRASVSTITRSSRPSRCSTRNVRVPTFHNPTPLGNRGNRSASVSDRPRRSRAASTSLGGWP